MLLIFHPTCHSRHVHLRPDSFIPFALDILLPRKVSYVFIFTINLSGLVLSQRHVWLLIACDLDFHVVGNFCNYILIPRFLLLNWLLLSCRSLLDFSPVAFAVVYFEYVPCQFYFVFGFGIVLPHSGRHRGLRFLFPLLSGLPHVESAHLSLLAAAFAVDDQ